MTQIEVTRTPIVWPPGPWDTEPKEGSQWVDDETGILCETWRHPESGHWCGYIYVPAEALLPFKTEYGYDIPGAHCGITYTNEQPPGLIKVGFDCGHAWDTTPLRSYPDSEYRTLDYVRACIKQMARAVKVEQNIYADLGGV